MTQNPHISRLHHGQSTRPLGDSEIYGAATSSRKGLAWGIHTDRHRDTHTHRHIHRDTQTHTQTQRHTHTDTHRDIHTHRHRHTHAETHRQRHTQRHTDTHTQRHAETHTQRHTDTETHTQTQTHTQRHTDRHTHRQRHTDTDRHRDTQTHTHEACSSQPPGPGQPSAPGLRDPRGWPVCFLAAAQWASEGGLSGRHFRPAGGWRGQQRARPTPSAGGPPLSAGLCASVAAGGQQAARPGAGHWALRTHPAWRPGSRGLGPRQAQPFSCSCFKDHSPRWPSHQSPCQPWRPAS